MSAGEAEFGRLLAGVLDGRHDDFALLYRPDAVGARVELLLGDVTRVERVADVPLPAAAGGPPRHEVLAVLPFRQIHERGFACHDDGAPLLALTVRRQASCPLGDALALLPDHPIAVSPTGFDIGDDEYAGIVRRVLADEIGAGAGSNFVIKRSFTARLSDVSPRAMAGLFRRLLTGERGAYWTFLVRAGGRTLVGATPERHVSLFNGTAVMNPISGTLRHPPGGPTLPGVLAFLADAKEAGELYMVVDEELKMMARITDRGGRVVGPYLRQMATLAHTEYLIEGGTSRDVRQILRETMFAPTVTGSPLENACRVIRQYEPRGRGYYSGVIALASRDANGNRSLDSAILLRTAETCGDRLTITVGATLVRDSDPASEVAETHAKARGMLRALGVERCGPRPAADGPDLTTHPLVERALRSRNAHLAPFWLEPAGRVGSPGFAGRRVLVVDAEDALTAMIGHQLRALGLDVTVRPHDEADLGGGHDLVVMGPGPGDPADPADPRIRRMHALTRRLLRDGRPFLAVCLSHQILGLVLGFDLVRRVRPNQGVQREIEHFGRRVRVGFYNTFALRCPYDEVRPPGLPGPVAVSRDPATGEVHGLSGPAFRSLQFHVESVLSEHGFAVLAAEIAALLPEPDRSLGPSLPGGPP